MAPTPQPQTEITNKTDADLVARAAVERAEKAERQNAELKKQLENARKGSKDTTPAVAELQAEVAQLRRERDEFRGAMEAGAEFAAKMAKGPKPLAPEHRGTRKYRTKTPCYREGEWKPAGSIVTITDERPSKTWVPLIEKAASPELVEVEPAGDKPRASDVDV